jgi:hypothetical protein
MKLANIISEIEFFTYEGMIQIVYDGLNTTKVAELLRALPGVTTVTIAADLGEGKENFKIKLISQKTGKEAFEALKQNALKKYKPIKIFKIGSNTIEKK